MEDRDSASARKGSGLPLIVFYVMAVVAPPIGFCAGIFLLFRHRIDGLAVMAISIVVGVLLLVAASRDDDSVSFSPRAERRAKAIARCVTDAPLSRSVEEQFRYCERKLNFEGLAP